MTSNKKEITVSILISFLMLILIIFVIVLVLAQFNPFKACEDKTDNFISNIQYNNRNLTCGELKVVNVSYGVIR
jgi:hypothetical protein